MGWKERILIVGGGMTISTAIAKALAVTNPINTTIGTEVSKVVPTVTTLKPIATAVLRIATATPTPQHTAVFETFTNGIRHSTENTPDVQGLLWGVGGIAVMVGGGLVWWKMSELFKWVKENFFEHDIQINAKRKVKGPLFDTTFITKDPKLAKLLIAEAGEEADITVDNLPLPVVATRKAIEKVLKNNPELLQDVFAEIENQTDDLKKRAEYRF